MQNSHHLSFDVIIVLVHFLKPQLFSLIIVVYLNAQTIIVQIYPIKYFLPFHHYYFLHLTVQLVCFMNLVYLNQQMFYDLKIYLFNSFDLRTNLFLNLPCFIVDAANIHRSLLTPMLSSVNRQAQLTEREKTLMISAEVSDIIGLVKGTSIW